MAKRDAATIAEKRKINGIAALPLISRPDQIAYALSGEIIEAATKKAQNRYPDMI